MTIGSFAAAASSICRAKPASASRAASDRRSNRGRSLPRQSPWDAAPVAPSSLYAWSAASRASWGWIPMVAYMNRMFLRELNAGIECGRAIAVADGDHRPHSGLPGASDHLPRDRSRTACHRDGRANLRTWSLVVYVVGRWVCVGTGAFAPPAEPSDARF